MTYTFDENTVSDLHKDARGFRPSQDWWERWIFATDQRKQRIWDDLIKEMEESIARERRMEQLNIEDFEHWVGMNMTMGAPDRATALRWMTQDEEFFNDQCIEHWVWNQGILFTDYGRELVKELKEIVTFKEYE